MMSSKVHTDEIDELVSSVRDFVSLKDHHKTKPDERLVLMPDQRVADDEVTGDQSDVPAEDELDDVDNVLILDTHQGSGPDRLESTIAELEAAVTAQSDDWEADDGEEFVQQAAWTASAFEKPETIEPGEPDMIAENVEEAAMADAMSEEALRALVVKLVHQELGGEMGERITQNVRKLVRREINRVLTSQDLGH